MLLFLLLGMHRDSDEQQLSCKEYKKRAEEESGQDEWGSGYRVPCF